METWGLYTMQDFTHFSTIIRDSFGLSYTSVDNLQNHSSILKENNSSPLWFTMKI